MNVKTRLRVTILTMAFIVAAGTAARADESKKMLLNHDATIAGSHLASGSYNIQWQDHSPGTTVSFSHGSKVVATAEGKVVDRGTKYRTNEVVCDEGANGARVIQEIRFKDSSQVIEFNQ